MNEPWKTEPQEAEWEHAGLRCRIRRNPTLLNLCGYVRLPDGHPGVGTHYDNVDVQVHGELTYGEAEDDGHWWVGFDCAHFGDLCPESALYGVLDGIYRDWAWVMVETERLAEQLASMPPRRLQSSDGGAA